MISEDQISDKTLEQFLVDNNYLEKNHRLIKRLVISALFSRFPKTRENSKRDLKKYFQMPVNIETIKEDGTLYAYINFNNSKEYVFVGRYDENDPVFEVIPNEDEMKKWKQGQE